MKVIRIILAGLCILAMLLSIGYAIKMTFFSSKAIDNNTNINIWTCK